MEQAISQAGGKLRYIERKSMIVEAIRNTAMRRMLRFTKLDTAGILTSPHTAGNVVGGTDYQETGNYVQVFSRHRQRTNNLTDRETFTFDVLKFN